MCPRGSSCSIRNSDEEDALADESLKTAKKSEDDQPESKRSARTVNQSVASLPKITGKIPRSQESKVREVGGSIIDVKDPAVVSISASGEESKVIGDPQATQASCSKMSAVHTQENGAGDCRTSFHKEEASGWAGWVTHSDQGTEEAVGEDGVGNSDPENTNGELRRILISWKKLT